MVEEGLLRAMWEVGYLHRYPTTRYNRGELEGLRTGRLGEGR
jgi:hypothetical protein